MSKFKVGDVVKDMKLSLYVMVLKFIKPHRTNEAELYKVFCFQNCITYDYWIIDDDEFEKNIPPSELFKD